MYIYIYIYIEIYPRFEHLDTFGVNPSEFSLPISIPEVQRCGSSFGRPCAANGLKARRPIFLPKENKSRNFLPNFLEFSYLNDLRCFECLPFKIFGCRLRILRELWKNISAWVLMLRPGLSRLCSENCNWLLEKQVQHLEIPICSRETILCCAIYVKTQATPFHSAARSCLSELKNWNRNPH